MQKLSLTNTGGYDYNAIETYRAEIGGVGGITNARSLAGMFTPLAQNNEKLLSKSLVKRLSESSVKSGIDNMLLFPTNFSEGFMLHMDNRGRFEGEGGSFIIGPNAFGHVGFGGSSATFADPDYCLDQQPVQTGGAYHHPGRRDRVRRPLCPAQHRGGKYVGG